MPARNHSDTPPPPDARSPWVLLRSATNHPFIYKKMVRAADPTARPGDAVYLYGKQGAYFGRGLYNPRSQIAVRVLTHDDREIDDAFWCERIKRAVALRRDLRIDAVTDAYRLVHAEGDALSGLIVERYADCLVVEPFSRGVFDRYEQIRAALVDVLPAPTSLDRPHRSSASWQVVLRADRRISQLEGFPMPPPPAKDPQLPERVTIREHGVRYGVDVKHGHKTGFFCDQRENRMRFAQFCHDADVLDLCCYTGGFSLCAKVVGGARSATGVDLDEAAVAVARENANLNQVRADFVYADAFTFVRQMLANRRQFDAVVLDPPKLATSRAEYDDALRKYCDFNTLALQVVRPGGLLLTCSCSGLVSPRAFREAVYRAAGRAQRELQLLSETGAAPDHPVMWNCPESAYLKALWLRVL